MTDIKKILHVDDDEDMKTTVKMILQSISNIEIDNASDGKKALEMIEKNSYDLVILDLMMQDMGGIEVFNKIKDKDIKIMFLTVTKMDDKEIEKYKKEGLNAYIQKPFENAFLVNKTKKLLHFHTYNPENKEVNYEPD
jgi:DNA-binding response OmpR family regulator